MDACAIAFCLAVPFLLGPASAPAQEKEEPRLVIDSKGHGNTIEEILFSPDGATLYSMGRDKTVRAWNAASGALEKTLRLQIGDDFAGAIFSGAISRDGRYLAVGGRNLPVAEGAAASITLLDLRTGKVVAVLPGHAATIVALDFSPDSKLLASGSLDRSVRLWNIGSLAELAEADYGASLDSSLVLQGHQSGVYNVRFAAEGDRLLSVSVDGGIVVWDSSAVRTAIHGGKDFSQIAVAPVAQASAGDRDVYAADFSRDGKRIATGDEGGRLSLWDGDSGERLAELALPDPVSTLSISPDGERLFASSLFVGDDGANAGKAALYRLSPDLEEILSFPVQEHSRSTASVWHSAPGKEHIAFATGVHSTIQLWKPDGTAPERVIATKGRPIVDAAFGSGGNGVSVAFGFLQDGSSDLSKKGLEYAFDFENQKLSRLADAEKAGWTYQQSAAPERLKEIQRTADNAIRTADGTEIALTEPGNQIHDFSFTPDGKLLVSHIYGASLYDGGRKLRDFAHEGAVRAATPSADGKYLATGSLDRTLRLWDLETGKLLVSLFVADPEKDDWVCWTDHGYFVSPSGGDYFGWHFNRGANRSADFLSGGQLFNERHQPEILRRCVAERKPAGDIAAELRLKRINEEEAAKTAPEVAISGLPTDGMAKTQVQHFTVEAIRKGKNVAELMVFHQDKRLGEAALVGRETVSGDITTLPFQVTMEPGRNEIKAIAKNIDGVESKPQLVVLEYEGEKARATLHLLAVGVNRYKNSDLNLKFCVADAEATVAAFKKRADGLFADFSPHLLTDSEATRPNIEAKFKELAAKAKPEDVFVFYYAGHGAVNLAQEGGGDAMFYLVPHDVTQVYGDSRQLAEKGVSKADLEQWLPMIPARKQLMLLDACESGAALQNLTFAVRGGAEQKALAQLWRATGTAVIASTKGDHFAREMEEIGHGIFTKALLDGIAEAKADINRNGIITSDELRSYLQEAVPELSRKANEGGAEQYPVSLLSGESFPVGLVVEG